MFSASRWGSRLEKHWAHALFLLLLLLFFWLAFNWTSYFLASPSAREAASAQTPIDVQAAVSTISNQHLFGRPRLAVAPAAPQVAAPPPLNVKLKGVFAATGVQPAYAIVNVAGTGDQPVKLGDELDDGVVLAEVHPGYVVVKQGAITQQLALEERSAEQAPRIAQPNPARSQSNPSRSSTRPKNGAAGPAPKTESAPAVINPAAGLKIENVPQDSIAQKLGLKKGDVVQAVNGQVVTSLDDLTRLYQQFSQVGQVILEGTRDGKPMKLSLGNL
ncbi:MAG: type II secretion system protein N [Burkholderiales bacterium]